MQGGGVDPSWFAFFFGNGLAAAIGLWLLLLHFQQRRRDKRDHPAGPPSRGVD